MWINNVDRNLDVANFFNTVDHFRWKELFTRFTLVDSTALINLADRVNAALSPHKAAEHRTAYGYSHKLVGWPVGRNLPAGCRVSSGVIRYYTLSLAGIWVNCGAGVAYRHVHTLRYLPGCIRAITFHWNASRVLEVQGVAVVNIADFKLDIELLTLSKPIFLPPTYSPAIIYFGRERGWWIACNYPSFKREKSSSDIMIFLFPTLFLM
jgi:hypothetical protein